MEKTVWDPLRKKEVALTPEEEVRQWFIGILEREMSVPQHMMRSEVGFRYGRKPWRADVVVFDRAGAPLLVVECKRPDVALDEKVLRQAMRYNSVLDVRFLVVTNGNLTYLYRLDGGEFVPYDRIPAYEEMICRQ